MAEQRIQLLKAKTLKSFADKFGVDEAAYKIDEFNKYKDYVRISDESVGGGIKKYGALSGKYVPKEIAKAIKEAELIREQMNVFNNAYFKVIDHIKVNITVKNPFTHAYNMGSNMILSYLHGDLGSLAKTIAMLNNDKNGFKKLVQVADELGLGSGLNDLEGLKVLKGDKKENLMITLIKNAYFAENTKLGDFARSAYAWEDKIFKLY